MAKTKRREEETGREKEIGRKRVEERRKEEEPKKDRIMKVKKVVEKWEIWNDEEKAAKSEEEAKKLVS